MKNIEMISATAFTLPMITNIRAMTEVTMDAWMGSLSLFLPLDS